MALETAQLLDVPGLMIGGEDFGCGIAVRFMASLIPFSMYTCTSKRRRRTQFVLYLDAPTPLTEQLAR
jgi:hypothetical protein